MEKKQTSNGFLSSLSNGLKYKIAAGLLAASTLGSALPVYGFRPFQQAGNDAYSGVLTQAEHGDKYWSLGRLVGLQSNRDIANFVNEVSSYQSTYLSMALEQLNPSWADKGLITSEKHKRDTMINGGVLGSDGIQGDVLSAGDYVFILDETLQEYGITPQDLNLPGSRKIEDVVPETPKLEGGILVEITPEIRQYIDERMTFVFDQTIDFLGPKIDSLATKLDAYIQQHPSAGLEEKVVGPGGQLTEDEKTWACRNRIYLGIGVVVGLATLGYLISKSGDEDKEEATGVSIEIGGNGIGIE